MTHSYPHKEFGEGFGDSSLDVTCEECLEMTVGHLDDHNFKLLTGKSREEWEGDLIDDYNPYHGTGLYNFWYAIMDSKAIKAFARRDELMARYMRSDPNMEGVRHDG